MRKNFGSNSFLYPMPVLIIAAYGENDVPSVMNAAWGGICGNGKIMMCVTPTHRTVKDLRARGAFTVSVGDVKNEVACDYVGIVSGNDEPNKFAKAGFTPVKSEFVDAPLIAELPMALDCKVESYDEDSHILIGEIVNVNAEESVLNEEGAIDPAKVRPITYDPVGHTYIALGEVVGTAFGDGAKLK